MVRRERKSPQGGWGPAALAVLVVVAVVGGLLASSSWATPPDPPGVQDTQDLCAAVPDEFERFADVTANVDDITCLAFAGITTGGPRGLPADRYGPDLLVERDEMASFIVRLLDLKAELATEDAALHAVPPFDGINVFVDVDRANPHVGSINRLARVGVVSGGPGGRTPLEFGPDDVVSRAQMASFLVRAENFLVNGDSDVHTFPAAPDFFVDDDGVRGAPHEDNIDRIAQAGIVVGTPGSLPAPVIDPVDGRPIDCGPQREDCYGPALGTSRSQMASFLVRVLADNADAGHIRDLGDDTSSTTSTTTGGGGGGGVATSTSSTSSTSTSSTSSTTSTTSTTVPVGTLQVPAVVGDQHAPAVEEIVDATLSVGAVTFEYDDELPVLEVIDQDPDAGASADPGDAVDLVVSLGPEPREVPDVVGKTEPEAEEAIEAAGFVVGDVDERGSDDAPPRGVEVDDVLSQVPAGGSVALAGTPVDLTLLAGGVNDPPEITSDPEIGPVVSGSAYEYGVVATDPDGDHLAYALVAAPDGMAIDVDSGVVTWTPTDGDAGPNDVAVSVEDGRGGVDHQSFTVAARVPNRAPVALDDVHEQRGADPLTVDAPGVMSNDSDPDGDELTVELVDGPTNGDLDLEPDGSFTYTRHDPGLGLGLRNEWVTPGDANVTPSVADLDGDGNPEVVYPGIDGGLRAVNGEDGTVAWVRPGFRNQMVSPILADVHSSPGIEVIAAVGGNGNALAVLSAADGTELTRVNLGIIIIFGSPAIADLDADGSPELVVGRPFGNVEVHERVGDAFVHRWTGGAGCGDDQAKYGGGACMPIVADVDLDGQQEVIVGGRMYRADGTAVTASPALPEGSSAVANFDADPFAEIVFAAGGNVWLLEHDLSVIWGPVALPNAGVPVVADVDGDGDPEIGIHANSRYVVLEGDGTVKWQAVTSEPGTVRNTSTAFDFDSDGAAEIVYRSRTNLSVYRGDDGSVLWTTPLNARASIESPVVADVDGDGQAEIVVGSDTTTSMPDGSVRSGGMYLFGSDGGSWARARPMWNQNTYHVTNIELDGTVPQHEQPNWLTPGLNTFRQNGFMPDETERADRFTYRLSDGTATSDADVLIDLLPASSPPRFTCPPRVVATAGFPYVSRACADDPDPGDTLTFSLDANAVGITVEPATGLLRWTPDGTMTGPHDLVLRVTDLAGHTAILPFTIDVGEPATVPDLVGMSRADAEAALDGASLTTGRVTEASHPTVPAGSVSGHSPGPGSLAEVGSPVDLVLSTGPAPGDEDVDGDGFSRNGGDCDDDDDAIHPGPDDPAGDGIDANCDGGDGVLELERIDLAPSPAALLVGETRAFTATGVYVGGPTRDLTPLVTWDVADDSVAGTSPSGAVTALAEGATDVTATLDGTVGTATLTVFSPLPDDDVAPTALLTSPDDGAPVATLVDVIGSAEDSNLLRWRLEVLPAAEESFRTVAEGTTAVTEDVLGSLDPTALRNGLATLRLAVEDRGGNTSVAQSTVVVDGNVKVGSFSVEFVDLQVAVAGLPITIRRTYDSHDRSEGDFGVGWRLGIETMRPEVSSEQGTGWEARRTGFSYSVVPTRAHTVSVTLPNGRVEAFDLRLAPSASAFVPLEFPDAAYVPRPGTIGSLEVDGDASLIVVGAQPGEVALLDETTLELFDPRRFVYTAPDGTTYRLSVDDGVEQVTDPNDNQLTITDAGITHSSGVSVDFERDGAGRINSITDPEGNEQTYDYDARGDLVAHTDRVGNVTRFAYDNAHNLVRIIDQLGRSAARNIYDADGRLVETIAADGTSMTYGHDLGARLETVVDQLGRQTVYGYDADGNLVSVTDPSNETTFYAYDALRRRTSETDPLGHTTTWTYDGDGNVTTFTDANGHTTSATYDGRGHVLTMTNPEGETSSMTYDSRGNATSMTNGEGETTELVYDAAGNLAAIEDPLGNVTLNAYDATGQRVALTDAVGIVTTMEYDANGTLAAQDNAGGPDWTVASDGNGRVTGLAVGANVRDVDWSPLGVPVGVTGVDGRTAEFAYDEVGRLDAVTRSDGETFADYTYDAAGQVVAVTDVNGRTLSMSYDEVGRQESFTRPDGVTTTMTYDAAGRPTATHDPAGGPVTTAYDDGGRPVHTTDAAGGEMFTEYDDAGRVTAVVDANGNRTEMLYDDAGRLVLTTFADGTTEERIYDDAGRLIELRDELARPTMYAYDAVGRLTSVADALGNVTRYEYDEGGRRTAVIDARGNATRYRYDGEGRLVETIYPLGQRRTSTFDATGRILSSTDANGRTVTFEYDDMGWLSATVLPDGSRETYTYELDGTLASVTDVRGTTTFTHDPATGRLTLVTEPDGRYVRYQYDAAGRRVLLAHGLAGGVDEVVVTATYDDAGRVEQLTDPVGGTTSYSWDAMANLTGIERPNGTATTTEYDERNRVTSVTHTGVGGLTLASFGYELDDAGNRTAVEAADGSRVEYDYDDLERVVAERHLDPLAVLVGDATYAYDEVGNLLATTGVAGTASWVYDANDQRTAGGDGTSFAYDADGNLVGVDAVAPAVDRSFAWDERGRMQSVSGSGATTTHAYDFAGNRVRSERAGTAVDYLVDRAGFAGLSQVLRESSSTGDDRSFVHGPDGVAQRTDAAGTEHLLADALGSVRLGTDDAGAVVDSWEYSAYGELLSGDVAAPDEHLFAGEQRDAGTGLDYLRARWYDPDLATFLSRDPAAGDALVPMTHNDYAYAWNNPVNHTDPTGLFPDLASLLVTAREQFALRAQEIQKLYRAADRVADAVGPGAAALGGGMAVGTFFEIANGRPLLTIKWFGFEFLDAGVRLGETAFTMLSQRTEYYPGAHPRHLKFNCVSAGASVYALAPGTGQFPQGLSAQAERFVVICPSFLQYPPLPNDALQPGQVAADGLSMAGGMLHEFTHIAVGTDDGAGYGCRALEISANVAQYFRSQTRATALRKNADNYRCIATDAFLGNGTFGFGKWF